MNSKTRIIEKIKEEFNLPLAEAKVIFDCQFQTIREKMEEGIDIPLPMKFIGKIRKHDR